jgi:ribosomal protein S18 acetylase RimI-like enzyme
MAVRSSLPFWLLLLAPSSIGSGGIGVSDAFERVSSPRSALGTTPPYRVERGDRAVLYEAAYMMATARLAESGLNAAVHPAQITSPVFSMLYVRDLERLKENFASMGSPSQHQILVARSSSSDGDDEVVGYVDVDRRADRGPRFPAPYLSDLVVRSDWRRRGVASALVEACCTVCASEWGEAHLHLWAETRNVGGLRLYRHLKFDPVAAETGPLDDPSRLTAVHFDRTAPTWPGGGMGSGVANNPDPWALALGSDGDDAVRPRYDRLLLRRAF